jgi:low affinity Fe/Cu permease
MEKTFNRMAEAVPHATGRCCNGRDMGGPFFGLSEPWQRVINTTTIITLPDGVPDPEHAEPRRCRNSGEA